MKKGGVMNIPTETEEEEEYIYIPNSSSLFVEMFKTFSKERSFSIH